MANEKPLPPDETPPAKLPSEILEWARAQIDEEEIVAGIREIRETGGLRLVDFIQEIEEEAMRRE